MTQLPTGTVTFLFADIEGSTRLAQDLGSGWPPLLERHRRIARAAWAEHHGTEVLTEGDSFFVVFERPIDAVQAAVAAQRGLAAEQWPPAATIRVRIGLHTGEGLISGGSYVGLDVHRASRIAGAGQGGQVLLSAVTAALVQDALPDGIRLREMGEYRLKDLSRPERLSGLWVEGLPSDFPALVAPAPPLRIALADDAVLLREALAASLAAAGFEVVGQAADVDGLLALVDTASPDVLVVDVRMPPTHTTEGLEASRRIRRQHPEIAILLLSQYIETRYAVELLRENPAGIGYLLKDRVTHIADLAEAVRRVAAGGSVIDPEVVARLLGRPRAQTPLDDLTLREREILALMAEGLSNHGIAERLVLDPKTIEGHVTRIFSKLGLEPAHADHRRVLAVLSFLRSE
jgi:DNA-binding NarL/FixJ family response regulator/class 3 adenylate cyclase